MADIKRYYWLKLPHDFFGSKRIKKLRKVAGGDTYTIIYLKMQLLSLKTNGILTYTGLEKTFAEELALDLDEDVENVQVTLRFLADSGLIETSDNIEFFLPFVAENTGCETAAAQRMRELRERQKALECNNVTEVLQERYVEKEKEIEIEKSKSKSKGESATPTRFVPPTEDEVRAYCLERGNNVDASKFVAFYESKGWMIGKNKMKNWRAAVHTWEQSDKGRAKTSYTDAIAHRMDAVSDFLQEAGYDGT